MTTDIITVVPDDDGSENLLLPQSRQTYVGLAVVAFTVIAALLIAREDETVAAIWVVGSKPGAAASALRPGSDAASSSQGS